jgi:hypothetical protein
LLDIAERQLLQSSNTVLCFPSASHRTYQGIDMSATLSHGETARSVHVVLHLGAGRQQCCHAVDLLSIEEKVGLSGAISIEDICPAWIAGAEIKFHRLEVS